MNIYYTYFSKPISLIFVALLLFACGDDKHQETDGEQQTENQSENADLNDSGKTTSKKELSSTSELQGGTLEFSYNDESGKVTEFRTKHTDILMSKNSMVIRIADDYERRFQITLMKPSVAKNAEGEYYCGKDDAKNRFILNYFEDYTSANMKPLTASNGTLKVESFNPETGALKLSVKTKIGDIQNVINKDGDPFELSLNMKFEKVIKTY